MLNTVGRFIYTKYWGILYVEHCGKIYLHKIVRNTVCWKLWDLFTQNTEEYCMLNTMRRFIYRKYWGILYVEHCGKIYLHKYWGILYVEHCGKIYLQKILRNTLCWTLWEDLFTQILRNASCWTLWEYLFTYNSWKYVVLNTEIYLLKIPRNTLCWTLWEDLFTQNTRDYAMLSTVGRFIYTKYWWLP